jgi:hypothetical protein
MALSGGSGKVVSHIVSREDTQQRLRSRPGDACDLPPYVAVGVARWQTLLQCFLRFIHYTTSEDLISNELRKGCLFFCEEFVNNSA